MIVQSAAPQRTTLGRRKWPLVAVGLLLLTGTWAAFDMTVVSTHSLREFDPQPVARLETEMWRSYYAKQRLALFAEMAELLRTQYHFSSVRSYVGAFYAARAAVVFQRGHNRAEYQRALPDLRAFYRMIRAGSDTPFDAASAARLELEWWILHRERARAGTPALELALASLQAEIYRMSADKFAEHAHARAAAMILRDHDAEHAGVPAQADWVRIQNLLTESWTSLWKSLH